MDVKIGFNQAIIFGAIHGKAMSVECLVHEYIKHSGKISDLSDGYGQGFGFCRGSSTADMFKTLVETWVKNGGNLVVFKDELCSVLRRVARDQFSGFGMEVVEAYTKYIGPISDLESMIRNLFADTKMDSRLVIRLRNLGLDFDVHLRVGRECPRCHLKCVQ